MSQLKFKYKIGDIFHYRCNTNRIVRITGLDEKKITPSYYIRYGAMSISESYFDMYLTLAKFCDTPLWRKLEGLDG